MFCLRYTSLAIGYVIAQRQNMSLGSINHEKYKIIDKVPYFKNHLKNPIFEIEGSNMDQMKENYLTPMNLVLTHSCPNVALSWCCSQPLIYIYIYINININTTNSTYILKFYFSIFFFLILYFFLKYSFLNIYYKNIKL